VGRGIHQEDVRRDLDGQLQTVGLPVHLHEHVALAEAEVAGRAGDDARLAQLLEQLGSTCTGSARRERCPRRARRSR
jgi:hypothetical protein